MKVKLLAYTKNAERVVAAAVRQCYSPDSAAKMKTKLSDRQVGKLIRMVIESDHTSTIEHVSFTFAIEGVSRVLTHELVRHRIASYSQQSQRYISADSFGYVVPPSVRSKKGALGRYQKAMGINMELYEYLVKMGIPQEDARFVLPNATDVKIVVTMNARSMFNFLKRRMCNRAQWEIRTLAHLMHKELLRVAPKIFKYAGPTCRTEGICWEGERNCGLPKKNKKIKLMSHIK